jgi:hypothetical protein
MEGGFEFFGGIGDLRFVSVGQSVRPNDGVAFYAESAADARMGGLNPRDSAYGVIEAATDVATENAFAAFDWSVANGYQFAIQRDGKLKWDATPDGVADTFLYRNAANVLKTDGAFEFTENADFAAPALNGAVLYAKDNGAGKTQIVARFNTGAVQVMATQP